MKTARKQNLLAAAPLCALALTIIGAHAEDAHVTDQHQLVIGKIPKPVNILVHDFVATTTDVPADSPLASEDLDTTPQTTEQIAEGKKIGAEIASNLVAQIHAMGMQADEVSQLHYKVNGVNMGMPDEAPQINDIVIRGYLLSVTKGNAAKHVAIGFDSGASELSTMVEGFQMRPDGLRKLDYFTEQANDARTPGAVLGVGGCMATKNLAGHFINTGKNLPGERSGSSTIEGQAKATATEIADMLKKLFHEQGWIN